MGLISVASLAEAQLKADLVWADGQHNAQYKAEVEGLQAILANQTATIKNVSDKSKQQDVTVYWADTSMIAAEAVESNCDIAEDALGANKKSYVLENRRKAGFSINEDELIGNVFSKEEMIAKGTLKAMQVLDEHYAASAIAKLDAFAGTNAFLGGYSALNGNTEIPDADYTSALYAYFAQAAVMNRMRDSYILDNGALFNPYFMANTNQGNGEGKGDAARFASMKTYFDFFNFPASGSDASSIMVNRSAVSFASRARFDAVPVYYGGDINQTRYSVESKNIKGLFYDVYYKMKCGVNATTGDDEVLHVFRVQGRADLLLNPEGTTGNTGVLNFKKGVTTV